MPVSRIQHSPVWFAASGVSSLVCAALPTSTEGLGGSVGVVRPAAVLLSWCGAPTLALGATAGLGGGLGLAGEGVSLTDGVTLGGGGLGAGTGAGGPDWRVSGADCGFGVTEGFSAFLQGWGTTAGAGLGGQDGAGSVAV